MSDKLYRAGAIGHTGAGNFGHALHTAYKNIENVEFIAVSDTDEAGRAKAVEDTGAERSYADYRDMLEKENLDLVSVCPRWVPEHVDMVTACLEAGCSVYCEKPMTMSLADGDIIVETAKKHGLKVAVAHQAVYLPATHAIRQMLNDGRIGTIQAIYASGKQDHRGGGEDMIVLGTHTFNMMRFFLGDVDWMQAHVTNNGVEVKYGDDHKPTEPVGAVAGDTINSYYAFKNGVSGFFLSRRDQAGSGRYGMEIVGSEGIFSLRGDVANRLMVYPYPVLLPSNSEQEWEAIDLDDTPFSQGNELAILDLIDSIENDRKPISAAEDAVAALEMILGTYESQLTGQRVQFPIENREHPLSRGN
ncbi:Gfo/Idh/MocA family oxidoreductase [Candidatus Poribacteria bacterium]|nr:Gfo/Idh/MocA family oxidoreductase [Candidatus Poribacteria bacterium]